MLNQPKSAFWKTSVVVLSLLLFFFTIPHTLEDFALGEPARNRVPTPILAGVISGLVASQGLALFELGLNRRLGYILHAGIGIFWPLAAGSAQLPVILTAQPYRSGFLSLAYVFGMIVFGLLLCLASVITLSTSVSKRP